MNGIRGLIGFQFWVDNSKSAPLEAMLQGRSRISEERRKIMRELENENRRGRRKNRRTWLSTPLAKF